MVAKTRMDYSFFFLHHHHKMQEAGTGALC